MTTAYDADYYSSSKAVTTLASFRFPLNVFPLTAGDIVAGTSEPLHRFIPSEKKEKKKKIGLLSHGDIVSLRRFNYANLLIV